MKATRYAIIPKDIIREVTHEEKTSPVLAVVLLIVVVVLMLTGKAVIEKYVPSKEKADLKEYYQLKEADDTAVIVDNVKQDTTAKLVAGKIYIEYRFCMIR